ncbi:MAG: magnesium transporter [Candidatus Aenigmatarchaeota archaeon]|nr:MAG: magnesium transporter [Candidatus Aenigmarchaeota archaeon]
MRNLFKSLAKKPRRRYHPLQHKIKEKHGLSKRTVFFMKEYGPHSHVMTNILRESVPIVLLSAIISSLGGVALEDMRSQFAMVLPLIMIVPALNHMVGSFGTIVASRFTTALFQGKIRERWWKIHFLHRLFWMMFAIAVVSAVYVASLAAIASLLLGSPIDVAVYEKLIMTTMASAVLLTGLIFNISVVGGLWIYKRGEDPNNFLIPITTALADFGSLIVFAYLVTVFF